MSDLTEAQLSELETLDREIRGSWPYPEDGIAVAIGAATPLQRRTAAYWTKALNALHPLISEVRRLRSSVPGTTPRDYAIARAFEAFKGATGAFPVGADMPEKGASIYNWRRYAENEIERMAEMVEAPPPSPGTTETGTREREAEILRNALRSIVKVARAKPAGTELDTVYGIARDAFDAVRSLAALPVSRGEATRCEKCSGLGGFSPYGNPQTMDRYSIACTACNGTGRSPSSGSETLPPGDRHA